MYSQILTNETARDLLGMFENTERKFVDVKIIDEKLRLYYSDAKLDLLGIDKSAMYIELPMANIVEFVKFGLATIVSVGQLTNAY